MANTSKYYSRAIDLAARFPFSVAECERVLEWCDGYEETAKVFLGLAQLINRDAEATKNLLEYFSGKKVLLMPRVSNDDSTTR